MLISFGASIGAFLQWIIQVFKIDITLDLDILHSFLQYYYSCVFQVIMHERMWHNSNPVPWMNVLKDKDVHEVSTVCSLDHGHSYCYSLDTASKNIFIWKFYLFLSDDDKHSQQMLNYHFFFLLSFSHWCFQPQSVQAWHKLHRSLIFILHLSYLVLLLVSLVSRHPLAFIIESVSLNFIGQFSILRHNVPISASRVTPYAIVLGFLTFLCLSGKYFGQIFSE